MSPRRRPNHSSAGRWAGSLVALALVIGGGLIVTDRVALPWGEGAQQELAPRAQGDDGASGGPSPSPAPAARPSVVGAELIDAVTGERFVPRGVNWTGFEYPCAQGWGYSELDHAPELGADPPARQEATALAASGANTVRVPLNQDCWLGLRGAPLSDTWQQRDAAGYQDAVGAFVAELVGAGLVVVLDLHSRKRADSDEFGNLAMPDADSREFWASVAARFAGEPSVLFDLFNEPYSRYDAERGVWASELTWECWRDGGCQVPAMDDRTPVVPGETFAAVGMAELVETVRASGAEQPIILSGLDYANDLSRWAEFAPDDDQLIAALHSYDYQRCVDATCWSNEAGRLAEQVPVLVTELGQREDQVTHVADFLAWAEPRQIGVLAWAWAAHADDPMSLLTPDRAFPGGPAAHRFVDYLARRDPAESMAEGPA